MGTGYVRNDTSNNIADANVIDAADLDGEFDAIVSAFSNSTGHTHDGTSAEGGAVSVIGPSQEFVGGVGDFSPKTDSTYNLGKTAVRWSTAYIDAVDVSGNVVVAGTVDGRNVSVDGTKLDGIESFATADPTAYQIKSEYESNPNTNEFSDAEQTKLSNIETAADVTDTTNVTSAGALMDSELANLAAVKATTGTFLTTDQDKLDGLVSSRVELGNAIINGAFDIWQRGDGPFTGSEEYTADRWLGFKSLAGVVSNTKGVFTVGTKLGKNTPAYFLRHSISGLTSGFCVIQNKIEDVRSFAGETVTVLGWVRRASGAGNIALTLIQEFGVGGSANAGDAVSVIALNSVWEPFAIVKTVASVSGKTIGVGSDLAVTFSSATASVGYDAKGVDYWGIHILQGTHGVEACDNYIAPRVVDELARCQRYCYVPVPKGAVNGTRIGTMFGNGGEDPYITIPFPVTMRGFPSLLYGGTSWKVFNATVVDQASATLGTGASGVSRDKALVTLVGALVGALEFGYLRTNASDCFMIFDAEL